MDNIEQLKEYRKKLSMLSEEEKRLRDLYLKKISEGSLQGTMTGFPSLDKPWLKYYTSEQINVNLPKTSVYKYLYNQNRKFLGRSALNYYGRKVSFFELFNKIEETAKALKQIGVKENEIVTISMPNTPEAVYLFYAISKIGAIANMVDPRTSSEGIKKYIEEVESKKVIVVDSYYSKVNNLTETGQIDQIIVVSPAESLPIGLKLGYKTKEFIESLKDKSKDNEYNEKTMIWNDFITNGANYSLNTEVEFISNRPLVIEHTGGTTGQPKGVILSNENINAVAVQSVLTGIDMQREHNWLDIMPTFIAYGVAINNWNGNNFNPSI